MLKQSEGVKEVKEPTEDHHATIQLPPAPAATWLVTLIALILSFSAGAVKYLQQKYC